jgi:hypothetical protein
MRWVVRGKNGPQKTEQKKDRQQLEALLAVYS